MLSTLPALLSRQLFRRSWSFFSIAGNGFTSKISSRLCQNSEVLGRGPSCGFCVLSRTFSSILSRLLRMVTICWSCSAFHWASNSFQQPFLPVRFSLSSSPKSQDGSIFTSRMPNAISYGFTGLSYLRTASDCSHYSCMIPFWLPGTSYGKVNISHMTKFLLFLDAGYRGSLSYFFFGKFFEFSIPEEEKVVREVQLEEPNEEREAEGRGEIRGDPENDRELDSLALSEESLLAWNQHDNICKDNNMSWDAIWNAIWNAIWLRRVQFVVYDFDLWIYEC